MYHTYCATYDFNNSAFPTLKITHAIERAHTSLLQEGKTMQCAGGLTIDEAGHKFSIRCTDDFAQRLATRTGILQVQKIK